MSRDSILANVPFKVITAIFNFYIPTTWMVILYVKIFLAIKRRSKEMEKMTAFQSMTSVLPLPFFYCNTTNTATQKS